MKATLNIPRPTIQITGGPTLASQSLYRFPLRWTDHHPASHYGIGVILSSNNEVIDGMMFRFLRDSIGAWIDSDDPDRCASALGVPRDEPGIGKPVASKTWETQ